MPPVLDSAPSVPPATVADAREALTAVKKVEATLDYANSAVAEAEDGLARALTAKLGEINDAESFLTTLRAEARSLRLRLVIIGEATR